MSFDEFIKFLKIQIKKLKLTADDEYIIIKDNSIISTNTFSMKALYFDSLLPFNNIIVSVDYIKGIEDENVVYDNTNIGIIKRDVSVSPQINNYNANIIYNNMMNIINRHTGFEVQYPNYIRYDNIHESNQYVQKMRELKAEDGALPVILDDRHIVIIAPTLIPLTKSNSLNVRIYDSNKDIFECVFEIKTNKKNDNVLKTISMFFLYL